MTLAFINVTASDANTSALARCALQTWFSLTCVHSADLSRFWLLHKLTCDCHKHAHEVESRQARRGRLPLCSFAASADRYSRVLAWYRTILVVVLRFHVSCHHVCHSLFFFKTWRPHRQVFCCGSTSKCVVLLVLIRSERQSLAACLFA